MLSETRSLKCCDVNPSGPLEKPAGKLKISSGTVVTETVSGVCESPFFGGSGSLLFAGFDGCFSWRASLDSAFGVVGTSSEQIRRSIALKLPSSCLAVIAKANCSSLGFPQFLILNFG